MRRSPYLNEILTLDPERDHKRITHLVVSYEFPFDTTRSLELAFFRTFAVPSIAKLLDSTGEFNGRSQKRYDDTDLLISTFVEDGYDSPTGTRAIRRMNQIHGRFEIANDDYLYVLALMIFEPIRWTDRFGWRRMVEQERLGIFHCWREIGRRMNIREIPSNYDAFERWKDDYERSSFAYTDEGARLARAMREMFLGWFPGAPRRVGRRLIAAALDEPLREAVGFAAPTALEQGLVASSLRARSLAVRALPPRRRPRLRTTGRRRSYPAGWQLETLGP